ncbi:MAG: T9SS type A sorting domain-containing protein [Bacteroidota bacterium]
MSKNSVTLFFLLIVFSITNFAQNNEFLEKVNYRGAFGSSNWLKGWTALDHYSFLSPDKTPTNIVNVTDNDINAGQKIYWTADNTYILNGFVYVEDGAVLNIEAGTVIKGKPGQGESASALVICQGAKIYAEGTAANPIIFTAEADNVNDPNDLVLPSTNLWGGVILLGKARINTSAGVGNIEGLPVSEKSQYGGTDDDDNSGVMRYVSIRHGGTDIGEGNEINGLTFGAVGRGTTIDHIEVFQNNDDGYEWFGGTVNCKYLVSAFVGDDSFDHDEGLRSKMQFLFAIQDENFGNHSNEADGGTDPEDGTPYAFPQIFNATFLGSGKTSTNADNSEMFKLRDFWGGSYKNSIFGDYAGKAMDVEDLATGNDSRLRLENGEIVFNNNIWFDFGGGNDFTALGKHEWEAAYLNNAANNNTIENPQLAGISRTRNENLDPRPTADGAAYSNLADYPAEDDFFEKVNYKGAFGSTNWLKGWTALDHYGFLAPNKTPTNTVTVTDASINAGEKIYWTADNTYLLDGQVYVEDGAVLNIEAGTVIKGKPGQGESASALVVSQGGKIYAEGTGVNPIVFTAESDNVTDPNDLVLPSTNLWGGVILLGKGKINTSAGVGNIEGLPVNTKSQYGGTDDWDNSGVMKYVSIRHGGTDIGEGNEINGLTFGAVGRGTTIDHIEVFQNNDDGYEWFGGTVNCKYLVSAFVGDDSFDHDEGLRSKMQFLFAIQDENFGNHSNEADGGTDPEDGTPYAFPQIFNATFLGSGKTSTNADNSEMFKLRDFWGGSYKNSIFGDYAGKAMDVEDLATGNDSRLRLENGEIVFNNNIWFDFGGGNDFTALGKHEWEAAYLNNSTNNNTIENPQLASISRTRNENLDPRPAANGPAYENLAAIVTGVKEEAETSVIPNNYQLSQNYPNPFNPTTTIRFALPQASHVKLVVYNVLGQEVANLVNGYKDAGSYNIIWDAKNLASGIYVYRLETGNQVISKKMTLLK